MTTMHQVPDTQNLYLMGDYHQGFIELTYELEALPSRSSVICLGDYDAHQAQHIVDLGIIAQEHGVHLYLMRGNHDHPQYWQDSDHRETLSNEYLTLLCDVDFLEWKGMKIVTVSGAVSVDRSCVRFDAGNCWPRSEGIATNAVEQVKALGKADILLTHTGNPDTHSMKNDFLDSYASTDETLLDDIAKERKMIQRLQIASECSKHYYGHFHMSYKAEQFGIETQCLDICEFTKLDYA